MSEIPPRDEVFRHLYAAHFTAILAYALRRVERPEDAVDIAADTFLVAWRRLAHGGLVPAGTPAPDIDTQATDRYDLGADIAGAVACSWLDHYVVVSKGADEAAASDAVAAMATARDWPILQDLAAEGDYPEVVWEYADAIAAGRSPDGFVEGLGCP